MDQEKVQGKVQEGVGVVKKVGAALDDPTMIAEGQNDQDEGRVHEALGTVREKMSEGAHTVKEKAEELGERLRDAAQRVTHHTDSGSESSRPQS